MAPRNLARSTLRMRFDDFVTALYAAGWRPVLDAQHTEIKTLWTKMFPVIAQLEDELNEKES